MPAGRFGPDEGPAQWRGFCVDQENPDRRLYVIPRGLSIGEAAIRAIGAGIAVPLAGGPIAFDHVDLARRPMGLAGDRQARRFSDLPEVAVNLVHALAAERPNFAGLSLDRPAIMGVINVTPNSFSDGGDLLDAKAAIDRGRQMLAAGADILDIGGESTRPGSSPVGIEEEMRRVLPVVESLAADGALVSIDTRHAPVMERAVAAGARIINDVTALTGDGKSEEVAAASGAAIVLMHMQGEPATMQKDPRYADVTLDLLDYFSERLHRLLCLGVDVSRIAIDPGIGFGKLDPHNLRLFDELGAFQVFGCPVLLGASRKSFIARLSRGEAAKARVPGTIAANHWGFDQGVQIIRVHDVEDAVQGRAIWSAIAKVPMPDPAVPQPVKA